MRKKSTKSIYPYIRYAHYAPARFPDQETGTNVIYHNKSMRKRMFPRLDWFKAARDRTLSRQMYGRIPYRNPLMIKPIIDPVLYHAEDAARVMDLPYYPSWKKKNFLHRLRRREQTGKRYHVPRNDFYNGYKYTNITGWLSDLNPND